LTVKKSTSTLPRVIYRAFGNDCDQVIVARDRRRKKISAGDAYRDDDGHGAAQAAAENGEAHGRLEKQTANRIG
jgi:hypothetical protein